MTDGLSTDLNSLSRMSCAETFSVSAENPTGGKGMGAMATEGTGARCARDLGKGWKISPSYFLASGETKLLADLDGPGAIKHIWCTECSQNSRALILRFYWDGNEAPSVECPLGDFFAHAYSASFSQINSIPVSVNPHKGYNCYWVMPFFSHAKVTIENRSANVVPFYYQIDGVKTDIPADSLLFHAQFRRTNPLGYAVLYTILDGIKGAGQYVGTYMFRTVRNNGWWGEGEIKFYIDGDEEYPTVCGTGTEDYFGGAYNFDVKGSYREFSAPYCGMPMVVKPDGLYASQQRFSLYRWHVTDPIYFKNDLHVTIQSLGVRNDGRYLPQTDDISTVAYWYQTFPAAPFPALGDADALEII